ncbi:hypothetical protein CMZ82_13110 [Lysobacteraceae bacterium NML93-0792]|nr:hypothetical protein CMZ82_13110 [Xanthomonadaceae bacterium NML93-0792]PBS14795.1 hypothetical protein CMZ81_13955 [Xanthomonadaceae bacterium NML93-0793]PBS18781.1 hypothetical protein CMZ80_10975 [Xanthomonadaceae bacterium NML93-0831]
MIDVDGTQWADCLAAGFGARVLAVDGVDATLTVFQKGPWRIGFVDFVSGSEGDPASLLAPTRTVARAAGVHALRFVANRPLADSARYARYRQPACRLPDLQGWRAEATDKGRRTLNRRRRTPLKLRQATREDAPAMHSLYVDTVIRQGGAPRYSLAYFEVLAPHAGTVALLDEQVVGFVCTGRKGERGLYLHGAHAPAVRAHHPSDLLYLAMLEAARSRGLRAFDFLASPQPGLLHYKEAWGGVQFTEWTSDLGINALGSVFVMAYAAHYRWRRRDGAAQAEGARATRRTSA